MVGRANDDAGRVVPAGGVTYWMSGALAVLAGASGLLTYLLTDQLHGPAAMNGSARGTALVVLALAVPGLVCSMALARRGSAIAVVTWLGAIGYLLYNALMFLFATPANQLFLLQVAMLSAAAWSAGTLLWHTDLNVLARLIPATAPVRAVAGYLGAVILLNGGGWLVRILPALAAAGAPAYLRGTGLTTNVVYVQDLALWLPLNAVAAAWLWSRKPRGYLLAGASAVMAVAESISIAVDQWYGHAADPASPVASDRLVPVFTVLALTSLTAAWLLLRGLDAGRQGTAAAAPPGLPHRDWPAWAITATAGLVAVAAGYGGIGLISNGLGMPGGYLRGTPLTGWELPGAALLIGVGVPQLAAALLIVVGHRWALAASYLAGTGLVAWILVQLLMLQRYFILQPVIAGLGILELLLAWLWQRGVSHAGAPGGRRHVLHG